jgi:diacylglycerol kinase
MLHQSFKYALKGLVVALKEERNFKIMILVFALVIGAGIVFKITLSEWISLLLISGVILVAELFNSTIETIVDLISPEFHPLAQRIKDMSAAAVLVGSIFSVVIGALIFLPYLFFL